ncbi:MAG TPA: hypothetical protein VNK41_06625 [Vicinamibacterales bacterium]|nr:hypothetical protein [Vicinamibacterales bacterium]
MFCNGLWTAATIVLLLARLARAHGRRHRVRGVGQAVIVAAIAELQYVALRRVTQAA